VVGKSGNSVGRARRRLAAVVALASLPGLAACVADAYAGIPLAPGAADAELRLLAMRARAGDEAARLELGSRFENGDGVPVDPTRACQIYLGPDPIRLGEAWIYSPGQRSMEFYPTDPPQPVRNRQLAFRAYLCRQAAAGAGPY
jgi:TPR repeat protein